MGGENFNQMEEDLNVIEIDYLTTLIIFIDDNPRVDIKLFENLYELKNKKIIKDYELIEGESKVRIKLKIPDIDLDYTIFNEYQKNKKIFYEDGSGNLMDFEDFYSLRLL